MLEAARSYTLFATPKDHARYADGWQLAGGLIFHSGPPTPPRNVKTVHPFEQPDGGI